MRYQSMQDDEGKYFINLYWNDESGMTRRETLYSDIEIENDADELCLMLNKSARFLHDLPKGVTAQDCPKVYAA